MIEQLFLIVMCAAFGWVFTNHTYIQAIIKAIPDYNILLPVKKILMCCRCFTFNFTLVALWDAGHIWLTIGQASIACVIASLIFNESNKMNIEEKIKKLEAEIAHSD
jgi:hypothetical protein